MNIFSSLTRQCNKAIDFVFPHPIIITRENGEKNSPNLLFYSAASIASIISSAFCVSYGVDNYYKFQRFKTCAAFVASIGNNSIRPTCIYRKDLRKGLLKDLKTVHYGGSILGEEKLIVFNFM